jgi:large subunit ribosomal protein L24
MSKWIRKGDKVVVLTGNEKGRVGTVRSRKGEKVLVEGLNVRKKHVRPKTRAAAGILDIEMPIHVSNLSLCNQEGKAIKVKVKRGNTGEKSLVYSAGGKEITHRNIKQVSAK